VQIDTRARQIDDAKHRPLLNRRLVVVPDNRDSIKNKSAPKPPILAADSRGRPSPKDIIRWGCSNHNSNVPSS
jgi:hypothetical protein